MSFFHGPSALGGFVFLIYIISSIIKKQLVQLRNLKANLFSIFFILILSLPLLLFYNNIIQIPYIGSFDELINPDYLIKKANINIIGSASYPEILIINNNYEIIPKIILKLFYFLYSPFIWDVNEFSHVFGFFDGILYLVLSIYLFSKF